MNKHDYEPPTFPGKSRLVDRLTTVFAHHELYKNNNNLEKNFHWLLWALSTRGVYLPPGVLVFKGKKEETQCMEVQLSGSSTCRLESVQKILDERV